MQEHEPWEIGEMRKKTSNYRDRAGRTELKRVRSSTHNGDIKALCHVETHHQRPRESLFTVLIHRLTVLPSTAPFPHRITVLPSHLLAVSPSYRYRIVPHRLSSPKYTESHRLPSFLTDTVLPHRYRIATRLAHRDSSVLPLSSITV